MSKQIPVHERKILAQLEAAGKTIVTHLPFNQLSEKVQIMVCEQMKRKIEHEYGLIPLVAQLRELFRMHNPAVTFFQQQVFNIRTERHELQKDCTLHDTEDRAIATALGVSIGNFYSQLKTADNE